MLGIAGVFALSRITRIIHNRRIIYVYCEVARTKEKKEESPASPALHIFCQAKGHDVRPVLPVYEAAFFRRRHVDDTSAILAKPLAKALRRYDAWISARSGDLEQEGLKLRPEA